MCEPEDDDDEDDDEDEEDEDEEDEEEEEELLAHDEVIMRFFFFLNVKEGHTQKIRGERQKKNFDIRTCPNSIRNMLLAQHSPLD